MTAVVERDAELALLSGAMGQSRAGTGSLVLVTGPLGIGRTALLAAAGESAEADDVLVLRADAGRLEQDFALGITRQLLEPVLFGASADDRRRWEAGGATLARAALTDGSPLREPDPPAGLRNALHQGLFALLANLSRERPVLLLVDDLQWADLASLSWLAFLARRVDRTRAVLVVSVLDGDLGADRPQVREVCSLASHTLRPRPLSPEGVGRIVGASVGGGVDVPYAAARVLADSGGNPLLLVDALAALAPGPATRGALALSEKFAATLAGQSAPVRAFARTMTLVGGDVEPHLIGRLAGLDIVGTNQARRVLGRLGLLLDRQPPRLLRRYLRVVEDSMTLDEHEQLQVRAAAMLHAFGYPAERAAACLLAVSRAPEEWSTEVLRAAADAALHRDDGAAAARYLRRALLNYPPESEERARLLVELATTERTLDATASVRHMSQAVALLPTPRDRAAAVVRLPPTVFGSASRLLDEQVVRIAAEFGEVDLLAGPERELAVRLEARARFAAREDPAELVASVRRLRAMGTEPLLDTWADRELVSVLLYAATLSGRLTATEVSTVVNRLVALEPVAPIHMHTTLPLLLTCAVAAESTQDVSIWLDATIEKATRLPAVDNVVTLSAQALVALRVGRLAEAVRYTSQACDLLPDGLHETSQLPSVALQSVAVSANDPVLARKVLAVCPELPGGHGGLLLWAVRQVLSASITAAEEPRQALDQIEDAGRRLDRAGWSNPALFTWRTWAAHLHGRLGERDQALRLVDEEYGLAQEWGAPATLGRTLRLRAKLLGGQEGVALLRQAVEVLLASVDQLELARTLVALGATLVAEGGGSAEEHLRQGLLLAEECGAAGTADRARNLLATYGVRPTANGAGLTGAERRIAELAADGQTNQDIAEEFGITRRAVEKHLTNCYRKMDIVGRSNLSAALRRLDGRPARADVGGRGRLPGSDLK
jgi:DNA-binding CsgD family transcriptional regulator